MQGMSSKGLYPTHCKLDSIEWAIVVCMLYCKTSEKISFCLNEYVTDCYRGWDGRTIASQLSELTMSSTRSAQWERAFGIDNG